VLYQLSYLGISQCGRTAVWSGSGL